MPKKSFKGEDMSNSGANSFEKTDAGLPWDQIVSDERSCYTLHMYS